MKTIDKMTHGSNLTFLGYKFFFSCFFIGHVTAGLLMNVNRDNGVIGMMLEQKKYAVMEIANICLVVHGG